MQSWQVYCYLLLLPGVGVEFVAHCSYKVQYHSFAWAGEIPTVEVKILFLPQYTHKPLHAQVISCSWTDYVQQYHILTKVK